jgi:hypothetical protein
MRTVGSYHSNTSTPCDRFGFFGWPTLSISKGSGFWRSTAGKLIQAVERLILLDSYLLFWWVAAPAYESRLCSHQAYLKSHTRRLIRWPKRIRPGMLGPQKGIQNRKSPECLPGSALDPDRSASSAAQMVAGVALQKRLRVP